MTEFILKSETAWEAISLPLFLVIFFLLIPIIARLLERALNKKLYDNKKYIRLYVVYILVLIVIVSTGGLQLIKYAIDLSYNDTKVVKIEIDTFEVQARTRVLVFEDKELYISISDADSRELNNAFSGKLSEVEYYRRSGIIKRITKLE